MAQKQYVEFDMTGLKILNVGDPTAGSDVATKSYVDVRVDAGAHKPAVRAATTGNITLSGTQTVDGVALVGGDRVLVKDQSSGQNNGIYVVAAGAWTRSADADSSAEVTSGLLVAVTEGTANGNKLFLLTTDDPITLGTTALTFAAVQAGTTGAPADAQYLVGAAHADLTAERAVTDTATVSWDLGTAGQAKANVPDNAVTDAKLRDSGAASVIGRSAGSAGDPADISASADNQVLRRSGGALGFGSIPAASVSDFDAQVRTSRLDQMAAPTGSVSMNSQKIVSLADPTGAQEAATKNYVDGQVAGARDPKDNVRAATTAAGTLATSFENGDSIDGVTLATGNRILIKNQAAPAENGIYIVNASGAPTRAPDADSSAEVTGGLYVWVNEGTANADTGWLLTTDDPITLGTTGLTFSQVSGLGQVSAGAALTKTGNTLDVAVAAGSGLIANADNLDTDPAILGRGAAFNVGDGAATAIVLTHNLGSRDVAVQVYRNSTPWDTVGVDVERTSTNSVTLRFAVAPATDAYRAVIRRVA